MIGGQRLSPSAAAAGSRGGSGEAAPKNGAGWHGVRTDGFCFFHQKLLQLLGAGWRKRLAGYGLGKTVSREAMWGSVTKPIRLSPARAVVDRV